jgi:hypothetical protein
MRDAGRGSLASGEKPNARVPEYPDLSPIVHNRRREASPSTAGTLFHIWRAIQEWIALGDDDLLYLEGAEDIDRLRAQSATVIQLRQTIAPVSLNNEKLLTALSNFWEHHLANPDRVIQYLYCTTAGIALEENRPFASERPGLELWSEIRQSADPQKWAAVIGAIRDFLAVDQRVSTELRLFLAHATVEEVYDRLIARVEFDTWSDGTESVREDVRRSVIRHGTTLDIDRVVSIRVLPLLVDRVLDALVNPKVRRLSRADFDDVFSTAVTFPVPANQLLLATMGGSPVVLGVEQVLQTLYALRDGYKRRQTLFSDASLKLEQYGVVVLSGSSGKGKTQLAIDLASTNPGDWRMLELRTLDDASIARLLRAANTEQRTQATPKHLIVDDFNVEHDARVMQRALRELLETCAAADRRIIFTSYRSPDELIRANASLSVEATTFVSNFTEAEIQVLFAARGAPLDIVPALGRLVMLQTGGHPTLVDARVEGLRKLQFPRPTPSELLVIPADIVSELDRARRFTRTLSLDEQYMLYRASIPSRSLTRPQLLAFAAEPIPPAGAVDRAGAVLDGLIGVWFEEEAAEPRLRTSELLRGLAEWGTDPVWMQKARRALVRAIMQIEPIDVRDLMEALLQSLSSEYSSAVVRILMGLFTVSDREKLAMLGTIAPWLTAVGIGIPLLDSLKNPGVLSLLRSLQYKVAASSDDWRAAELIGDAVESDQDGDLMSFMTRLFVAGAAMTSPPAPADQMLRYGLLMRSAISELQELPADHPFASLAESTIDNVALDGIGGIVIGSIRNTDDLRSVVTKLGTIDEALARTIVEWSDDTGLIWRGVAATLIVSEADQESPNFIRLIEVLREFAALLVRLSIAPFAAQVVVSAAVICAERLGDVAAADDLIDSSVKQLELDAYLTRAKAVVRLAAEDWDAALALFKESFTAIKRTSDDVELPLDMRLAANAAGNVERFDEARELMEGAAALLESTRQPTMAAGMLMDAAFAAWRAGADVVAFKLADEAIRVLRSLSLDLDDARMQNTIRRFSFVLLVMTERRSRDVEKPELLPAIGFASNVDPLPEHALTVPFALLYASLALLEQRVLGTSSVVDSHFEDMSSGVGPQAAIAAYLRLNSIAVRGDIEALVPAIVAVQEASDQLRREGRFEATDYSFLGEPFVALTLLGRLSREPIYSGQIRAIEGDAAEAGLSNVEGALTKIASYMENRDEAKEAVVRGKDEADRRLASVAISASVDIGANLIFLAQQAQVALFGLGNEYMSSLEIIRNASVAVWRRALPQGALFKNDLDGSRSRLGEALDLDLAPREHLLQIFLAAESASNFGLQDAVRRFLEEE